MFHLKSNCIKGGYTNVTVNDDNEAITVKLLDELKVCKIIMSLEGKHDASQATTFSKFCIAFMEVESHKFLKCADDVVNVCVTEKGECGESLQERA